MTSINIHNIIDYTSTILKKSSTNIIVRIAVNLFFLGLIGIIFYQNRQIIPVVWNSLSIQKFVTCLLLYIISLVIQATIWISMIGYRQQHWYQGFDDFIQTYLMGRLPGGWWKWLGRITVYRALHLSKTTVLWVSVAELALLTISGASIIIVVSLSSPIWQSLTVFLSLILAWLFFKLFIVRRPECHHLGSPWQLIWYWCGYSVAWLLGATILYLLAAPLSVTPLSLKDTVLISTMSGLAGIVVQFLPISALLRDIALGSLLNRFMDLPQIVIAVFMIRIIYSLGDMASSWITSIILLLMRHRLTNKPRSDTPYTAE